jgi:RNA polymerase sigma factor (sigma-70 family)
VGNAAEDEAFAELYRTHVQAVFGLAHRLTGQWSVAEDVVAETFLVAWRTREHLVTDERPLRPWLLGIAAHQSMNATRGVRRRLAFLSRRTTELVVEDFADELAGRLDDAERLARTRDAMRSLSRREAEVIGLCVWSGLSYAEAAEALGVPVGTVRSRLSRARARLKDLAEPARDDPSDSGTDDTTTRLRGAR